MAQPRDSRGRFVSASGNAKARVDVDTSDAQKNLRKLKKEAQDTKKELTGFEKAVNTAFGSRNIFQVTNFNRALSSMVDTMKTLSWVMVAANTAIVTFFGAIVKELNKLQGFLSIMTLSTKSSAEAGKQFEFLRSTANQLGIDINAVTSNYAKLVAAVPDGNEKFQIANKVFTGLAMAARTLHASTLDTQLMFYAVTQMASKGVISMEELRRQLGERLPGAMEIAARAANTTTQALEKAIRTGQVQSIPFLKLFGPELIRTFAASADIAANTVDAALNRLTNVWVDFVKTVLDSGAGQQIVNVFDALREKLSDPYVMSTFATMIGEIAQKTADFVKSLTAQDMLNAFMALKTGIEAVVTITLKLIEAMSWIVNNSKAVGALIGALAGAGKGAAIGFMFGGPTGALIGAGIGAAGGGVGGYMLGSQIQPSSSDTSAFADIQRRMNEQAEEQKRQVGIMLQSVMGSLGALGFNAENMSNILPMIEKRMGFTADTAGKFASILYDKQFKSLQERQAAALELASTGYALGPRGTLESLLGAPTGGKGGKAKKEPTMPKVDELREGQQYIEMLQKRIVKEEELTEVEKIWRALSEQRLQFNSAEKFTRAMSLAQILDEKNATEALNGAVDSLTDSYQSQIDKLEDRVNKGLMTEDQAMKNAVLREFSQKTSEEVSKIPAHFQDARAEALAMAEVLQRDLAASIDAVIEKSRSFAYGWESSLIKYVDDAGNYAKAAEGFFTTSMSGMEDAIVQFATTGKLSFRSLIDSMLADLARFSYRIIMSQIFKTIFPNMGQINGIFPDNGLAGGDGFVVNPFAGYASGGPVMAHRPILVGENGAEVFVPNSSGKIVPHHQLGGSGSGINITYHIGSIGSNVSRQDIAVALDQTRQATISQIADMRRRNATVIR